VTTNWFFQQIGIIFKTALQQQCKPNEKYCSITLPAKSGGSSGKTIKTPTTVFDAEFVHFSGNKQAR